MIGISEFARSEAMAAMGPVHAAVVLAAMLGTFLRDKHAGRLLSEPIRQGLCRNIFLWPDGDGSDAQGGLDFTAVTSKGDDHEFASIYRQLAGQKWPRNGGPEHPAVYHMLDVAAVAEILIAREDFPAQVGDALALLVGLHDLGKVGNGFRAMIREGAQPTKSGPPEAGVFWPYSR